MAKMRLIGTLEAKEYEIVVENSDQPHLFHILLDGRSYVLDAHEMTSEIVTVLIDHKSYDIDLDRLNNQDLLDGRMAVHVRGRVIELEMLEERRKKMKDAQVMRFSENGFSRILSPMPGKILRILVSVEEQVEEGQGLVVVEAMKMENELKSPKKGVVKEVSAKTGDSVDSGALLVTIE
jgi:biotin carboxyl carrier protein